MVAARIILKARLQAFLGVGARIEVNPDLAQLGAVGSCCSVLGKSAALFS